MIARKCTLDNLNTALAIINKKYAGNIRLYEPTQKGKTSVSFRLKVNNPKGAGAAKSAKGKSTGSGCWHAHGDFFEALISINPDVTISTRESKITKDGGNWQDWNIGSQADYMDASEGCLCNFSEDVLGKTTGTEAELIDHIKSLDSIEDLLYNWEYWYGEMIMKHCAKDLLPLYINHDKLGALVAKRLASTKKAA
jgi:hypothetical protein